MKDDLVERLKELRRFLDGSAPIIGLWFGELNPKEKGKFWWRKYLDRIDKAIDALSPVLPEEAEEVLQVCTLFSQYHESLWPEKVTQGTAQYYFKQAADLIKRLARDVEFYKQHSRNAVQRIEELEEELESERINNEDLANATYYKGNSVSWWHSKAGNYKNALGEMWDVLRAAGVHCDGKKSTADGVKELQQRIEELEEENRNLNITNRDQWMHNKRLDAALAIAIEALKALAYEHRYAAKKLKKVEKARAGE